MNKLHLDHGRAMDGRAFTALPNTRTDHRHVNTDVTTACRVFNRNKLLKARPFTTFPETKRRQSTSEKPPNFSWVDSGWLAACALPNTPGQYRFLFENGIRHVVSLMKQKPEGALDSIQLPKLNRLKIRIEDFCAPTLHQIRHFIKIVEGANDLNEAVVVHCENGNGRTGTMVACYLMKTKRIKPRAALQETKRLRPGFEESLEQEKAVEQYYHHIRSGKY